jgi:uncharacterized membrane protein
MNMRKAAVAAAFGAMLVGGCAQDMSDTTRRTGTGALGGAAIGGAIGSLSGNFGWGALIGAGAGAAGGYLFDQHQRANDRAFQRGVDQGRRGG